MPLILDKEDLYTETGLTKIFEFKYFKETTLLMAREED
jgi:hypothetical protein